MALIWSINLNMLELIVWCPKNYKHDICVCVCVCVCVCGGVGLVLSTPPATWPLTHSEDDFSACGVNG